MATSSATGLLVESVEDSFGDAPYEMSAERKVLIQPYDYAVRSLMDMVIEGDLQLDPDYQRQYRWDDEKASRFVESIALNIPVPVLYLAEEVDGRFSVIDGQQRLTSLMRFMKPAELSELFPSGDISPLELSGLKIRPDMNGRSYINLSSMDRSAIAKRPIRCIVVLNESDPVLKFEVFERLNTGSASLTDQEVRNCIYRGSFNSLIKRLASNQKFREMISLSEINKNNMKDAELVLRVFAYSEVNDVSNYSGNYAEYLNSYMEVNREIGQGRAAHLEDLFSRSVDLIYEALGPQVAFRKPSTRFDISQMSFAQNLINGSIFESQMIAVLRLVEAQSALTAAQLRDRLLGAFAVEDYWGSLFQGTTQKAKVIRRNIVLTGILLAP